jgi:hypothetical protein
VAISETYSFSDDEWREINETAVKKFQSIEWLWGRNPATKIMKPEVTIEVDNGVIVNIESSDERLKTLVGKEYNYTSLKGATDQELLDLIF